MDGGPSLDPAFDGAEDLLRAWRDGLTPDPDLTVSAWADRHRILSPRGANEAGPWRTSRTPYLREIMDALSPRHPAQRVERIDPLIEESPALREKVAPSRSRDSGNTVLSKEFPGGIRCASTVAIAAGKAKFFPVGAPGVFKVALSPAEFFDYVNTPGLDLYAMTIPDRERNAWVKVEVYSYPLFICTRPEMLQRAKRA